MVGYFPKVQLTFEFCVHYNDCTKVREAMKANLMLQLVHNFWEFFFR